MIEEKGSGSKELCKEDLWAVMNGASIGKRRKEGDKCTSGSLIPDAQRNNEIINK